LPARLASAGIGDKLHKGATVMTAGSTADLYGKLVSIWQHPERVIEGLTPPAPGAAWSLPETGHFVQDMMASDLVTYLPDDILCKVDRAAMGVSLETRVPFLDHRVVEFAWRLPLAYKLQDGVGKWLLRQVLDRYVPRSLIERPKMGFGVPLDSWLRGPLRDWAESLLDPARLRQEGFFRAEPVRERWQAHLSGRVNAQHELWCVLMFQAWLENNKGTS
ncbi:MAG: asparagine synthase C-terminal domain-containing protein, partial [Candidatus Sericytochromatia bacterium]|nr:asparagine synthase C-terminal domain-containing protein [Candidatus Sericytochromatia bacterium]